MDLDFGISEVIVAENDMRDHGLNRNLCMSDKELLDGVVDQGDDNLLETDSGVKRGKGKPRGNRKNVNHSKTYVGGMVLRSRG